jgi:outer membrane receptor for ferrienterochelin and colicin
MKSLLPSTARAVVRYGLVAALSACSLAAQATSEPQKLEKFVVTGSLIPIAADSPANPVTVINAAEIEKSGTATDLLDVLKKSQPYFYGGNNIGSETVTCRLVPPTVVPRWRSAIVRRWC